MATPEEALAQLQAQKQAVETELQKVQATVMPSQSKQELLSRTLMQRQSIREQERLLNLEKARAVKELGQYQAGVLTPYAEQIRVAQQAQAKERLRRIGWEYQARPQEWHRLDREARAWAEKFSAEAWAAGYKQRGFEKQLRGRYMAGDTQATQELRRLGYSLPTYPSLQQVSPPGVVPPQLDPGERPPPTLRQAAAVGAAAFISKFRREKPGLTWRDSEGRVIPPAPPLPTFRVPEMQRPRDPRIFFPEKGVLIDMPELVKRTWKVVGGLGTGIGVTPGEYQPLQFGGRRFGLTAKETYEELILDKTRKQQIQEEIKRLEAEKTRLIEETRQEGIRYTLADGTVITGAEYRTMIETDPYYSQEGLLATAKAAYPSKIQKALKKYQAIEEKVSGYIPTIDEVADKIRTKLFEGREISKKEMEILEWIEKTIRVPGKIGTGIYTGIQEKPVTFGVTVGAFAGLGAAIPAIGGAAWTGRVVTAAPAIKTVGLPVLKYGIPTLYGMSVVGRVGKAEDPLITAGEIVGGEIIPMTAGIGLGTYGYRRYVNFKELAGLRSQLPANQRVAYDKAIKEAQKYYGHRQPVKELDLKRLELVEKYPQIEAPLIEYLKSRDIVVGGSIAQQTQMRAGVTTKRPGDIDAYTKGWGQEAAAETKANEIKELLQRLGIKNVNVVKGTKVTIDGKKLIELHPYDAYYKSNIEQIAPWYRTAESSLTKTPGGVTVMDLTAQWQRKIVGGYLSEYETKVGTKLGFKRIKDIPAAEAIKTSILKGEVKPTFDFFKPSKEFVQPLKVSAKPLKVIDILTGKIKTPKVDPLVPGRKSKLKVDPLVPYKPAPIKKMALFYKPTPRTEPLLPYKPKLKVDPLVPYKPKLKVDPLVPYKPTKKPRDPLVPYKPTKKPRDPLVPYKPTPRKPSVPPYKPRPGEPIVPPYRPTRKRVPPPYKPDPFKLKIRKKVKRKPVQKKLGWNVYGKVIKTKKYKKLNKVPLTRARAKDVGAYIADHSLSTNFKLKSTRQKAKKSKLNIPPGYYARTRKKFRDYRIRKGRQIPMKDKWIERKGKSRLDTRSEVKRITLLKKLAERIKKITKTSKKKKFNTW